MIEVFQQNALRWKPQLNFQGIEISARNAFIYETTITVTIALKSVVCMETSRMSACASHFRNPDILLNKMYLSMKKYKFSLYIPSLSILSIYEEKIKIPPHITIGNYEIIQILQNNSQSTTPFKVIKLCCRTEPKIL